MARILALFVVLLFVIQRTFAGFCTCSCCTLQNCNPQIVDIRYLWDCSNTTCTREKCEEWHFDKCPSKNAYGDTKAQCGNSSEQLLSSLFIVFGITSIIFMIKNKF